MAKSFQVRQGDVLIERVKSIPKDLKKIKPVGGRTVLAEGEATGHAHTLPATDSELFEVREGEYYLKLGIEADVMHQEHDPITLPPGDYFVRRQREYEPERIRLVAD